MLSGWLLIIVSLLYISLLFGIAYVGDKKVDLYRQPLYRKLVYSFSLAVFCTSWTFYGAVGRASYDGIGFFPIYLGPMLVLLLGAPVLYRIVAIAKRENTTSIADFIASRYGKSPTLAVLVTLIAVVGVIPYIALQLKAVSMTYNLLANGVPESGAPSMPVLSDTALYVALLMAVFTILFGTRQLDATEHHQGMMQAVAFESVIKLVALLAVGLFVSWTLVNPPAGVLEQALGQFDWAEFAWGRTEPLGFVTQTLLAACAILLLPRQFHTMVVENVEPRDVRTARWLLPLYLLLTSLFVLPIAAAGLMLFPGGGLDQDTFVLSVPLYFGADWLTTFAFLGGGSAATGMVIVSTVALSTMICNEIAVPLLLRLAPNRLAHKTDLSRLLLTVRRVAILIILLLAYLYYRTTGEFSSLTSIGLLSFVAVAQFAPALVGGVLWRHGNRQGAIAGLVVGAVVWTYTLIIPAFAKAGWINPQVAEQGLFGNSILRPEALFGMPGPDPITHGALWSLGLNLLLYVLVSLLTRQRLRERIQVAAFFDIANRETQETEPGRGAATNEDILALAERFLGRDRTQGLVRRYLDGSGEKLTGSRPASPAFIKYIEDQLSRVIGSSTARVVLDSTLKGRGMQLEDVVSIVDEASQAMQFSRELLQSAIENISMGISVVDRHLRLVAWNQRYLDLFDYPRGFVEVGRPIEDLVRFNLERSSLAADKVEELVKSRMQLMRDGTSHEYERTRPDGTVLLIQGNPMPGGGFVTTFSDITQRRNAEQALKETNTYLERRVEARTEELEELNKQLMAAKSVAEKANQSKTRFLASASHDLLQPLNAARLFVSALAPRVSGDRDSTELVDHIDRSLTAAEEILSTLLDISKLDAGALEPQYGDFPVDDLLGNLAAEFALIARDQGLELHTARSSAWVHSDPQMLRRVIQNFLSNSIRYTRRGKILLGCRRTRNGLRIEVWDTGPGIPEDQLQSIFEEFKRLNHGQQDKKGLGLGLAIVERICRVLKLPISVRSVQGQGSLFAVTVPYATVDTSRQMQPRPATHNARAAGSMAGLKVLCIDNEPAILEGMKALLSHWQADVRGAMGFADAQLQLQDWQPDVMLADYQLDHQENGLDLMDHVRQVAGQPIAGVLITALNDDQVKEHARRRGYQYLRKPVKPAGLRAVMQQLSRGRGSHGA